MPAPPSQHFSFSPFPPFPSPHPSSLAPLLRPVPFQFAHVALPILPLPFLLSHRPPPTYRCNVGSRMSHVAAEARSTFALCFRMLVYKRRLFLRGSSSVPVCARSRSGGQTAVVDCVVFSPRATFTATSFAGNAWLPRGCVRVLCIFFGDAARRTISHDLATALLFWWPFDL